jgi:hypothetical protein
MIDRQRQAWARMEDREIQPQPVRRVPEDVLIRRWRLQQFYRLGFDADAARQLANSQADLSLARQLVRSDCELETARAIIL